MKIAIVGAHGVGKTTLTRAVELNSSLVGPVPTPMRDPEPGTRKSLQRCSDAEVLRLSQRRYGERIVQEHSGIDIISDGSVLHEWTYAAIRLRLGMYPDQTTTDTHDAVTLAQLDLVKDFTAEADAYAQDTYDEIFFIPIEFSLPREGAPISNRFQSEAGKALCKAVSGFSKPVHFLSGPIESRLRTVLAVLNPHGAVIPLA